MKKSLALILAVMLVLSCFAACDGVSILPTPPDPEMFEIPTESDTEGAIETETEISSK